MIRGVNLGGWLVLEKWITPSLFQNTSARDEYTLCEALGASADATLKQHRDSFITEDDFRWIAEHGLDAVRLPVGYWIFDGDAPYIAGIEYVDKAFEWAARYRLGIVLDLHGATGSQNGNEHSGRTGDIAWNAPENRAKSLHTIERLAERYKGNDQLIGIELLNEPSWLNKRRVLREYYEHGYDIIRKHCGTNVAVIAADAFHPKKWGRVMQGAQYQAKWLDVHLYQLFNKRDKKLSIGGHIDKTNQAWRSLLAKVSKRWPIMVGEWSIALDPQTFKNMDTATTHAAYRAYGSVQLQVFEAHAASWFYWTYKTQNGGAWSYRDCVANGWLPATYSN
ncbi:MAG: glycoside hydrolase family 5 protein [Candidatus Saccharimonadales bacterium]